MKCICCGVTDHLRPLNINLLDLFNLLKLYIFPCAYMVTQCSPSVVKIYNPQHSEVTHLSASSFTCSFLLFPFHQHIYWISQLAPTVLLLLALLLWFIMFSFQFEQIYFPFNLLNLLVKQKEPVSFTQSAYCMYQLLFVAVE